MLAYVDYRIPQLFNQESAILILVFSFLAFLVSPICPLPTRVKPILSAIYLPLILIWWWLFKVELISLNPHIHYYLHPRSRFTWDMNTGICYAFGVAFSHRLSRSQNSFPKIYGRFFLVIFLLLITSLFFGVRLRPALTTT